MEAGRLAWPLFADCMSWFSCHCGAVIADVEFPSPTEGTIRTEQDQERFEEQFSAIIAGFAAALISGSREAWIKEHFQPGYPLDLPDSSVVADLQTQTGSPYELSLCECRKCGRLYIQRKPGENDYVCFEPRSGEYEAILLGKAPGTDISGRGGQAER
jgi:hypothetical protein